MNKGDTMPMERMRALAAVFFGLIATACGTVPTYDRLPKDAARGYVEFYAKDGRNLGLQIPVWQELDSGTVHVGNAASWSGSTELRVACIPGNNTFMIKFGTASPKISVDVKENYVTPVEIEIIVLEATSPGWLSSTKNYKFNMRLREVEPFLLSNEPTKQ